jgi:hypothetical protein
MITSAAQDRLELRISKCEEPFESKENKARNDIE